VLGATDTSAIQVWDMQSHTHVRNIMCGLVTKDLFLSPDSSLLLVHSKGSQNNHTWQLFDFRQISTARKILVTAMKPDGSMTEHFIEPHELMKFTKNFFLSQMMPSHLDDDKQRLLLNCIISRTALVAKNKRLVLLLSFPNKQLHEENYLTNQTVAEIIRNTPQLQYSRDYPLLRYYQNDTAGGVPVVVDHQDEWSTTPVGAAVFVHETMEEPQHCWVFSDCKSSDVLSLGG